MEKENSDILNLVADTIIKWYQQTHTTITQTKPASQLDVELMGILLAARKQTLGALTTLANKNILSSHVLLRIIVETYVVLHWVLNVPENDLKAKSDEVYKRLRRWDYTRLRKDKVLFEKLPQTPEVEAALCKIHQDIDKLQKVGIKDLPNNKQLCDDLGERGWKVYTDLYMRYSRVVHLNRNITQKLAWVQKEGEKLKDILYKDDIEPDGRELTTTASISADINKAIRGFYGGQPDAIQNEYEQLRSKLIKK